MTETTLSPSTLRPMTALSKTIDAYLLSIAIGAAAIPALLAYNVPPSATFFNQAAALIGWALVATLTAVSLRLRSASGLAGSARHAGAWPSGLVSLVLALCIVALSAAAATLVGPLPASLSLSAIGMIGAALLLVWTGAAARAGGMAQPLFKAVCIAVVVAGLLSVVISFVQVLLPHLADGVVIAAAESGRAAGNLRQANHLASLVVWAAVAVVWLFEERVIKLRWPMTVCYVLFVFTAALSGSRTGIMELVVLVLWGALDSRLSGRTRFMLLLTPVLYAACWYGMDEWARSSQQLFVGAVRRNEPDISSSRFAIWSNAIEMIKAQPWLGTGFGQFNIAWTLTPFPHRPVEFFDHPHNLVLHLAAELGIPLAAVVTLLLCWALWRVFAVSRHGDAPLRSLSRAAFLMIVTIAIHSMLEYPLWYAYFLLPTALMFGLGLGREPRGAHDGESYERRSKSDPTMVVSRQRPVGGYALPLLGAAVLTVVLGIASLFDYERVVVIFDPPPNAGPLMDRIAAGEHSLLFAHHAGYADATTDQEPPPALSVFASPIYYLLDARLMMAWADAYARSGDTQKAAYLAARLHEFRNPDSASYFAPCAPPVSPIVAPKPAKPSKARATVTLPDGKPYQCTTSTEPLTWRDFR